MGMERGDRDTKAYRAKDSIGVREGKGQNGTRKMTRTQREGGTDRVKENKT